MRNVLILGFLAIAATVWSGVAAQQETLPRPGPGSGITRVAGSVSIDEMPDVNARQRGEWRVGVIGVSDVRVSGVAEVRIASPNFIRQGRSYEVTWPDGVKDSITIAEIGANGWFRVGRSRWVNLDQARSVAGLD